MLTPKLIRIVPEGLRYNVLNAAGNPLTFDAAIELRTVPPASPFQPNYPVWIGSMRYATFESLEEFINLVGDAYLVDSAALMLRVQGVEYAISWDCDKGYMSSDLVGAAAVQAVASQLNALIQESQEA